MLLACLAAVAFSSGSAATSAIIHLLDAGSHVVSIDDVYGGTQRYFKKLVERNSTITFSFADLSTDGKLEEALRPNTKLIWMETPTNPTLKIADIRKIAAIAKARGILLAVDNTFMSAYFQRPLELGADLVINSVTKFVNGHSDVVMGFVATRSKELWQGLRFVQNGACAVCLRRQLLVPCASGCGLAPQARLCSGDVAMRPAPHSTCGCVVRCPPQASALCPRRSTATWRCVA